MVKFPSRATQLRCALSEDQDTTIIQGNSANKLEVTFHRTVRVPDNSKDKKFQLPPNLGMFSLLPVSLYKDRLPRSMVVKGGVFLPMYQREAMWIRFESVGCFAIKLHVGGVNAISGEPANGSMATKLRQANALANGNLIQDYLAVPQQNWLDGICHAPDEIRQFVAVPHGTGYSVEAQVTDKETEGGIFFDVWAEKPTNQHDSDDMIRLSVSVQGFRSSVSNCSVSVRRDATVHDLKKAIAHTTEILPHMMRLKLVGEALCDDSRLLSEFDVQKDSVIWLVREVCGGGKMEMALAVGGRIEQNLVRDTAPPGFWDLDNHVSFNVQIVNSQFYSMVTGRAPPQTPINAKTYSDAELPFFKLYDEPSGIFGTFAAVKSVKQLDKYKKGGSGEDYLPDEDIDPQVIGILPTNVTSQLYSIDEMEGIVRNNKHATF